MTYALGRVVDYGDMPAVRAIVQQSARDDYRMGKLVMSVVQSPTFRQGSE